MFTYFHSLLWFRESSLLSQFLFWLNLTPSLQFRSLSCPPSYGANQVVIQIIIQGSVDTHSWLKVGVEFRVVDISQ